jgi:HEAT repeat protein/AAA+ ATPase superfamily predicted ATPase
MANSSEEALESMDELVHSRDPRNRLKASSLLKAQDRLDESEFILLKRLIKDNDEDVSQEACCALGHLAMRHSRSYDYMMELLAEDLFWVKVRGIWALGECARYDPKCLAYLEDLAVSSRKETVEQVIPILCDISRDNPQAFEILKTLLRAESEKIIEQALLSIGTLAGEKNEALMELEPYLESSNNFLRLRASKAVGEAACQNDHAFEIYRELGKAEDVYLRRGFSMALSCVFEKRPKKAWELFERAVIDTDRYVRTNATKALGSSLETKAHARLVKLLAHDKADVRRGAAEGLLVLAPRRPGDVMPVFERFVDDEDYHLRSIAAFGSAAIAHINPKHATKVLKTLAEDRDEYVRRDIANAIGNLHSREAKAVFNELRKLLSDRENIVRREAAKSLATVAPVGKDELLEMAHELAKDSDEAVREHTATLLYKIAHDDTTGAFECLLKLAVDDSPSVRKMAAMSLEYVFDVEPDMVIPHIWILLEENTAPETLQLIGRFARSEDIGRVSLVYGSLSARLNDSNVEKCVQKALSGLENVKSVNLTADIRELFMTFRTGIKVRSMGDIALVKLDETTLDASKLKMPSTIELGLIGMLREVPEMAVRYKQIEGLSDKRIYLGKILTLIDSALERDSAGSLPEIRITEQVLTIWRGVVSQTMDGLKGSARINVILRTKKLLPLDSVTLLLGIENAGESLAENVTVELSPSSSYNIIDKKKEINMLAREGKDVAEFRIKPTKNKNFRVEFNITYDDLEMKGKSIHFADRVSFIDVPREFRYIPNPYITGGPIKPGSKDMFFGRAPVFDFIRNNISSRTQKNVLIIQGERRTGKTSILYQIPEILGPEYICAFLDGQEFGKSSLDYFFYRMAKAISNSCAQYGIHVSPPPKTAFKKDPWYEFKDQFMEELSSALGDRYLIILFDEFESLEYAVDKGTMDAVIFNYIRNLMQHEERLVFIFAGVHKLEEMMQDYWGVMFNIALYWKVSFLDEDATRKLIVKPVEGYNMMFDDLALEKIIRATACHPYFVQLLCRFLINRHNSLKKNYITIQDVNQELDNVVEKAKPHFNYIWTLSSPNERILLAVLPEILRKKKIATPIDILQELEKLKLDIPEMKISSALKTLCAKDILERVPEREVHFRFKVDFIRMWIEKHQPLDRVLEAMEGELARD